MPLVTLVDLYGNEIGSMEKTEAHKRPILHRAFSVFLLNPTGDSMLLQRRALTKYHSGGLWTNACCSHPTPGESVTKAARRRMDEELQIHCHVTELFQFVYCHQFDANLFEYEFDHVLLSRYEGRIEPNPDEADEICWLPIIELETLMLDRPMDFTPWFLIAAPEVLRRLGGCDEQSFNFAEGNVHEHGQS